MSNFKIVILLIAILITSILISGCNNSYTVYALGSASDMTGKTIPGYWKDTIWINIEQPKKMDNCGTYAIAVSKEIGRAHV